MKYDQAWISTFAQIDLKNVTIKIVDGATPANELEIKIGEGNLTYSEMVNRQYIKDRGLLDEVRNGDEEPMDVRFDFKWDYIQGSSVSSDAPPSVEEALKQTGQAAGWTSTDSDACRPYAVDIVLLNVPSPSGCGDMETITLPDFRYEEIPHDLRAGTISCTGKCNATKAIVVREAQS
jgi:hypothetical protein